MVSSETEKEKEKERRKLKQTTKSQRGIMRRGER
jgi:hypothetical protein